MKTRNDSITDSGLDFVKVSGLQFSKDCRPFFVAGFNTHDAVTAAMLTASEYKVAGGKSGKDQIRDMFRQAALAGLSVFRMWVHTDDPQFPFQVSAGVYDEASFRALDFIIEEARRNGLKILLCFVDNWKYYNGIDQAGLDPEAKKYEVARHALFYNDTDCRKLYKSHVSALVHRKNTFNGRLYRDDPTIFAWDLLNEPRCETWRVPECGRILQKWIEEMSAYVKSIDTNHMVTIGSEGFFKHGSVQEYLNPQDWAGQMGQDFLLNHIPEHIDFATIHVWPDTWDRTEENFEAHWIMSHVDTASFRLGKPVLVEEFGKKLMPNRHNPSSIRVLRDPVFKSTYSVVETAIAEGRGIGGTMFWRWDLPMFLGSGRGEYGVAPGDSTFEYVSQHATFTNQWISSQPPRPECQLGCWIPHKSWISRQCEDLPEVCKAYWQVAEKANNASKVMRELRETSILVGGRLISMDGLQVYPSKASCCRPGLGAFDQGCSWTTWWVAGGWRLEAGGWRLEAGGWNWEYCCLHAGVGLSVSQGIWE
ncbi:hypothetical protein BSKO_00219 [Bryopsis sp. KO-2023]|nr:hypothetical protein BSKO_00219 [Bryopsis sp. KO-2023]